MQSSKAWRRQVVFSIVTLAVAVGGLALSTAHAQPAPPPPPPPPKLTPLEQLGQVLFNDKSLSNPTGMSCQTCHAPQAGWEFPVSTINQHLGPVPGVVPGRFGNRKVPTISYLSFGRAGPTVYDATLKAYAGGFFWDGRAANLTAQAPGPIENPNEMNNLVHNVASPALVVQHVQAGPNAKQIQQVFGANVFSQPTTTVFNDIISAIVAFEGSGVLSPFNSKYDAYLGGRATLTSAEMAGLELFTGSSTGKPGGPPVKFAQCALCHQIQGQAGDIFTNSTFHNTGVPKNPTNPYYTETSATADPVGYNKLGAKYIDYGLGDVAGGNASGVFKVPTLRNSDARPSAAFVKCYGHNGFFKSLAQIVHFYNTRNLTSSPGEVINYTKINPLAGLKGKPLWPSPEVPSPATLVNPAGLPPSPTNIGIGNLGLSKTDEANLVAFLQTLTDAPPPPAP